MAEQPETNNTKDDKARRAWKIGSQVEIFSDSKQKWLKGRITKIINDEEGEWLIIKYSGFTLKEIQRSNKYIRPIIKKHTQKKIQKQKTKSDHNDENNDIDYTNNINKYRNELQFTWQQLLKIKDESGLAIYNTIIFDSKVEINMTTKSNSIQMLFQNTNLKQQSLRFMNMLNTIILKLDEPEILIQQLKVIASRHTNLYKVESEHYLHFKHGFMKAIKRKLIHIWNIKYDNAWEWFWNFMMSVMTESSTRELQTDYKVISQEKIEMIKIKELEEKDAHVSRDDVTMNCLLPRMDNMVNLVENALVNAGYDNEEKQVALEMNVDEKRDVFMISKSIIDEVDIFCCALKQSLMDESVDVQPVSEEVIKVPKFKFTCYCGSKFLGDVVGKFTQKDMVCSVCETRCESFDWIWNCSNTNYKHSDNYCLCVICGDKQLQGEMDINVEVPTFKFLCDCGSKFVGDVVGKFTQKDMVCSVCEARCESVDWVWNCSNTNYKHSDNCCLCVTCGDKQIQSKNDGGWNILDPDITDMEGSELPAQQLQQEICDCGGIFIASKTYKCFGCDRFLDTTVLHCNKCGNTYGYSTSMESMDILCVECAKNQITLDDFSQQPIEQKFTLSTDTVEEFGGDSSMNLRVGYNWSENWKSGGGDGFDNVGFVMNNNQENELQVMMKLSYLQARVTELHQVKLEITSLFELKNHNDFKIQTKKEQATIMEIIDILNDMKNISPQYYQQYSRQHKWAQHLLDIFDNILFNDNPYDAFNE